MSTNEIKMKFGGASPIIFMVTILVSIPIIVLNHLWKSVFEIHFVAKNIILVFAFALLAIGIPLYFYTIKQIKKAFQEERLITKGVFATCRNPLFAIVIFLILPGILLFFKSWLLLIIPLLFYTIFHVFIGREEKLLEDKFGKEFIEYKKNTSRIIPMFWKFRK